MYEELKINMSILHRLGANLVNISSIIEQYENDLDSYENNLKIKGKTLETALKEQPTWSAFYGERAIELNTLVKFLDAHVKKVRGGLTVQYNENYNPALSDRMMEKYIDREQSYLDINELLLEVKELADKYSLILDSFNRRGFALRDITQAKINSIQMDTL